MNLFNEFLKQGNYIVYFKPLAHRIGVEETIYLMNLVQFMDKIDKEENFLEIDGKKYFFRTAEKILEDTALSIDRQKRIKKKLVELGILETKRKGIPAKTYFFIDTNKIMEILGTSSSESHNPVSGIYTNKKEGNPPTIYNNKNNNKNNIEIYKEDFKFLKFEDVFSLFKEYLEIRKKIKAPNTPTAIKRLLNKIKKLADEAAAAGYPRRKVIKQMLEEAIVAGWKSVYLPKEVQWALKNKEETKKTPYNKEWVEKQIKENESYKNSGASKFGKMLAGQFDGGNDYIDYNKHDEDYINQTFFGEKDDNEPPF